MKLDLCTSRKFSLSIGWLAWRTGSAWIEFSTDGILINCDNISNHVPHELHLVGRALRQRRTEISKSIFDVLCLFSDFFSNFWQVMFDMSEHDFGALSSQYLSSKQAWWHCGVERMCSEVKLFSLNGILDWHVFQDILLRPIFDTYIT